VRTYQSFNEKMILRDYLALDRTILANERTLLAYIRTFIALLSAGIGMIHLLDNILTTVIGYLLCAASPLFLAIGIIRHFQIHKTLMAIDTEPADTPGGENKLD